MLRTESTTLRAPRDGDWDVLGQLRNDVDLQLALLARPRPNSEERVRTWVERLADDPRSMVFVVAETGADGAVGFVQLTGLDTVSGHAWLGIAIAGEHQGQGHGAATLQLLTDYARQVWGLRKMLLEVRADNDAALALYTSCGFRAVGTMAAHFRVGDEYHDVVIMEHLFG